jgi:hypothetical protein
MRQLLRQFRIRTRLNSSRSSVELLELYRQKAESVRALQRLEDDRRVTLLKELQDAATAQAASRIKIEALESDLESLAYAPGVYGIEQKMQRTIELVP